MNTLHQVIEGRVLNKVISLPKSMQDIYVEIIVKPAASGIYEIPHKLTREELKKLFLRVVYGGTLRCRENGWGYIN